LQYGPVTNIFHKIRLQRYGKNLVFANYWRFFCRKTFLLL